MNIESTNSEIEQTIETSSVETENSNSIPEHEFEKLEPTDPDYIKYSPYPIGYNSIDEQIYVYTNLLINYSADQSILDIGCGRADLYKFICDNYNSIPTYTGIDHNPIMLEAGSSIYGDTPKLIAGPFETAKLEMHDWVVASGIFTPSRSETEGDDLIKLMDDIDILYKLANKVVSFNLLTPINTTHQDGFFYVHPGLILDMLIEKYQDVVVYHNYSDDVYTVLIYKN
jgi:SAM-dependent methyltransferase